MTLEVNHLVTIIVQVAIMAAIVQNNRTTVGHLKEQNEKLEKWLQSLQKTVNDLRIKIGQ